METIEIKVSVSYGFGFPGVNKWEATLKDWDLGVYIGTGKTIQDAIDDFIDMFYDGEVNYKWS